MLQLTTPKNLIDAYTRAYLQMKKLKIRHGQDTLEIDKIYSDTINAKKIEKPKSLYDLTDLGDEIKPEDIPF